MKPDWEDIASVAVGIILLIFVIGLSATAMKQIYDGCPPGKVLVRGVASFTKPFKCVAE